MNDSEETESTETVESLETTQATELPQTFDIGSVTYEIQLETSTAQTEEAYDTTQARSGGNRLSESETYPEVVGDDCYGDWRWPANCRDCDYRISWAYVDETDEIEFSVETKAPSNWWTGVGFSKTGSMDDADFVVVKSQNGVMSLHDMHSNGYKAPSMDEQQDVYTPTVVGTHINGVMRATFTRMRDTGDSDDASFWDGGCYYMMFPVTGGRLNRRDAIEQKPTYSMPHECQTEFRYPTGCEDDSCDYIARWLFYDATESVHFEISARELGRWTGIGFSRDGNMTNSDIITGWVYDDQAYITDRFAYGKQLPAIDPSQDLIDIGGKIEDDLQTIWFTRKASTSDTATDYSLEGIVQEII